MNKHTPMFIPEFRVVTIVGLLICTLISENQGLEKSRSVSNIRKISGPANLDFFSRSPPRKKARFIKAEKNPGDKLKKKIQVCRI